MAATELSFSDLCSDDGARAQAIILTDGSFELAVWDFDGVIADTEPIHRSTYLEMLARRDIKLPADFFNKLIGRNESEIWSALRQSYRIEEPVDVLRVERNELLLSKLSQMFSPNWFVVPLLNLFAGTKAKQIIVSSGSYELISLLLRRFSIDKYFDTIYATHYGRSPEMSKDERLRRALGESASSILIEDDPRYLATARERGATTIGVVHKLNNLPSEGVDFLINAAGKNV